MRLTVINKKINLWLLLLLLCMCEDVLPKNPYKSGEVRADYPKGCAYLGCKRGDQCVNRKFWCRNPPCPSMLYCSKSRKESLKGPSSCEAVRCSKGFTCLARVRHCRWDEPCEQQIARCVLERDYYDGPASCVDFKCPSGLRCILRESLCANPPCKLVKSCANTKDVKTWYERCKSLGCLSEHECFLRRPTHDCRIYPCKHTPDCSAKSEEELEANEHCRGWICPKGEDCSAFTQGPCKRDSCRISRSCHRPLMVPLNVTPSPNHSWRDDVKLSFYSKLDKKISTTGMNRSSPVLSTSNKVLRSDVSGAPNPRPASSRPVSASPDIISGRVVQPTVTSLSTWLNHLKLKTGVDAIEAWIKKAEKQENYGAFVEWLESVKDMLGSAAYDLWLEEVRTMTVTSPAFQKWLPLTAASSPSVSPDFVEPVRNIADVTNQGHGISPGSRKSIKYRSNQDANYSQQEMMNGRVKENGAMEIDDFKKESYISTPRNDTAPIQVETLEKNPIPNLSGIPTWPPRVQVNEWQQFYTPDSRIVQEAYPFQKNVGNFVSWGNQAPPFQGFDTVNLMNPWFHQFQQPPGINPQFSNPNTWQAQFSPLMDPQRNQVVMNRRFMESTKIPDQEFQTNWTLQQPPNANLNFLNPKSWGEQFVLPVSPKRDQISIDRRFLDPEKGSGQQFQTDWSFQQPLDTNPYVLRPNTWQDQFSPSLNPQQQQDSIDQKFVELEKFPEQQFQTKWLFPQALNTDPNFLRSNIWQEKLFPPPNPERQQERDPRDNFNRRIIESAKFPDGILRRVNEEPFKVYFDNSTNEDASWMRYFLDQTSQQYVPSENFGTSPVAGENFGFESWPGSRYRGRSLADVPHRRTKHEDSTRNAGRFRYGDRDGGRSGETSRELFKQSWLFPAFPWLMGSRLQDYYLHLRDQDRRNLYDRNNREGTPALSSLSRTNRVDADAHSPSPNPFFDDSQRNAPRLKYHWPISYLHDRIYRVAGPRLPPSSIVLQRPAIGVRDYDERLDPFSKLNGPEVNGKLGPVLRDREFNAPEQSMEIPDMWNSKFRTPLSSVLNKVDRERWGRRDVVEKKRKISTTISPPVVPSSRSVTPKQVVPIASDDFHGAEDDDYEEGIKNVEKYDEDDGIYPLLLSLQGYIETSQEDGPENPAIPSTNLTILPVYTVEDDIDGEEEFGNDYESPPDDTANPRSSSDDQTINFFKNINYGGTPDFPNNLQSVFEEEAAIIMKNMTGDNDVQIKDRKWDYEDDEEDTSVEDPSSFFVQSQDSFTPNQGLSSIEETRGWAVATSGSRNEGITENDYYDEVADYDDKAIHGDRSHYNFQTVNAAGDLFNDEEVPADLINSFQNDPNHKRFKKNRP